MILKLSSPMRYTAKEVNAPKNDDTAIPTISSVEIERVWAASLKITIDSALALKNAKIP